MVKLKVFPDTLPVSGPPVPPSPDTERGQAAVPVTFSPVCWRVSEKAVVPACATVRLPCHEPVTSTVGDCDGGVVCCAAQATTRTRSKTMSDRERTFLILGSSENGWTLRAVEEGTEPRT